MDYSDILYSGTFCRSTHDVYACDSCCMFYLLRQKIHFYLEKFYLGQRYNAFNSGDCFKGIFPFIMTMFGKLEIFFVNGLGLPFHSGTIAAFIIMIAICYFLISYTRKMKRNIFQTIALSVVFMMIGFHAGW